MVVPERPPPPPSAALSPKREASQKIVQMGEEYLQKGLIDKALHTFQEAVNVDSENGVAYFFLAKALYEAKAYEDALGLLDRADSLLASYPDWHEAVSQLRVLIEQANENKEGEAPKEGYY